MTFAAEAWWIPPGTSGKRMATAVKEMEKAWRTALRVALPVFRTTPTALLHHPARPPPAAPRPPPVEHFLDPLSRLHAVRLHRLDPAHPLRARCRVAARFPKTR